MNIKALIEKRNALVDEMTAIAKAASDEVRAFTEDEQKKYSENRAEVDSLDSTIRSMQESAGKIDNPAPAAGGENDETRAFVEFIRTGDMTRADFTKGDNGAVIPSSIANKIIDRVKEISPIFGLATRYNVRGSLSIPYYDESTQAINVAYADEFEELTSSGGKFISITLTGFLAGALCKISRSLIGDSNFDILSYVVEQMSDSIALFIEGELINGTTGKIDGLTGVKQVVTAAASTAITADELIDVQDTVPDAYQGEAIWVMSRATRTAIRKLKDGDGNYLLNKDATSKWGYSLFGKPVYISEKIADMAAGKTAVLYGDFSGLAVKISEDINMQVLQEKYATQHVVGVVSWLNLDAKVENQQKIAALKMK